MSQIKEINEINEITEANPLWLVGCGKMGSSLLRGWLGANLKPAAVTIIDPYAYEACPADILAQQCYDSVLAIKNHVIPSVIVLAVKPQIMHKILEQLSSINTDKALLVSVAAGVSMADVGGSFTGDTAVVRAMPNIPAAVGKGMTAMVKNQYVDDHQKSLVEAMFKACGEALWLDREDNINAVTAVSGSGPAYVFYMLEAMASAGVELGLDIEVAEKLARQTIVGAAAMLEESGIAASELRENVTSPKGTTAAALNVLMADDGLSKLMSDAMTKAYQRGQELSLKN